MNTQIIRLIALAGLTLCFIVGTLRARADDPAGELTATLDRIGSMHGKFEQQQIDGEGTLLSRSSGSFQLLRPGYFAWRISEPDDQLFVTDGDYLWHHDRELETVTRRPLGSAVASSPLMVIGGDTAALAGRYEVKRVGESAYLLRGLEGDHGFSELTIAFRDGDLHSLSLVNELDQRVDITFSEVSEAGTLTPADFTFTPPPGADIFYYDE